MAYNKQSISSTRLGLLSFSEISLFRLVPYLFVRKNLKYVKKSQDKTNFNFTSQNASELQQIMTLCTKWEDSSNLLNSD